MDVANPIYDVVFKYLMQDQRVARLLIGRITGLAVQSLTVSPQGTALRRTPEDPEHDLPLTLLRMTFAARVQTHDGSERQVLIEILKANSPTVIERFRRYLDQQIGSGDNILTYPSGRTEAVPIVTIYFLGYALDDLSDEAVIDVCPRVTERRTGRELAASHPLVEGIHHRSHIIQIPRLASRRRDELERLLAIFDQGLVKGNGRRDAHVLTIDEGEYPVECAFVLWRLREAMAEEEVRRTMEGEDLLFRDSMLLARQVEYHKRRAEQERQRAQRAERAQQSGTGAAAGGTGAAAGGAAAAAGGAGAAAAGGAGAAAAGGAGAAAAGGAGAAAAGGAGAAAAGGAGAAAGGAGAASAAHAGDSPPAWPGAGCRGDRRGAGGGCGRGAARAVG